jgi:hypothetical protein
MTKPARSGICSQLELLRLGTHSSSLQAAGFVFNQSIWDTVQYRAGDSKKSPDNAGPSVSSTVCTSLTNTVSQSYIQSACVPPITTLCCEPHHPQSTTACQTRPSSPLLPPPPTIVKTGGNNSFRNQVAAYRQLPLIFTFEEHACRGYRAHPLSLVPPSLLSSRDSTRPLLSRI